MDPGIAYSVLVAFVWDVYIFTLKRYFPGYSGAIFTVVVDAFAVLLHLPVTAVMYDPTAVPPLTELGATGVEIIAGTAALVDIVLILFASALETGDVSYVAPTNKLVPTFVLPIEILFLNQFLTDVQILGVVVATIAAYVTNYEGGTFLDPFRRAVRPRPAQLTLVSTACYVVSDVGKRITLQELGIPTSVFIPVSFVGSALAVLPVAAREWPGVRGDLPKFTTADVPVAVGEHVTSAAFRLVPANVASPIVNTQAIVVVVPDGVALQEARFDTRLVAAVLVITGVSLVALDGAVVLRVLVGWSSLS